MKRKIFLIFIFMFAIVSANAQDDADYLKSHAIQINDPEKLNDSIHKILSPFQVIMFGEMHGTNESALFDEGLVNLLTRNGDSVLAGLEIPPDKMTQFISQHTDSSIYQCDFFQSPSRESGRESFAWAKLISTLNKNPKVKIFFFDINNNECPLEQRDNRMYVKIKSQIKEHPAWKIVTMSGNFHNRLGDATTMSSFLKHDKELNLSSKICSLNLEYSEGTCLADFGHGLQLKRLGHPETIYDTVPFEKYFVLVSGTSTYEYTGLYYTKYITAAQMVKNFQSGK